MIRLAVISPNKHKYSETFIHAQLRHLDADVFYLYGGYLPTHHSRGLDGPEKAFRFARRGKSYLERSLARYLKAHKIQLVLAHYGPTGTQVIEACAQAKVPLLVHFHGYDVRRDDIWKRYGEAYPQLFQMAAGVIGSSQAMCHELIAQGAPASRVHYIPYGPQTENLVPCQPAQAGPQLLFLGRMVAKKAPYLALLAFERVARILPEARLTFVGEGPLLSAVQVLSQSLALERCVAFAGAVPHEQVKDYLATARALVLPSVRTPDHDSEGTPVSVLEAGWCGLPVIGSRHAGIPEVVVHEETGLLVDAGDIDGLASCMMRLLKEPELAARLGQRARQRIQSQFSLEGSLQKLQKVMTDVTGTL